MRDEFSVKTKETLAKRVGYRCSNPSCRKPTSGPQVDPTKVVNIGVAAHITAATDGGPRYDKTLTSKQRQSVGNGIWLCQNCAKLVDNDPAHYPVALLHAWKAEAEQAALLEIEGGASPDEHGAALSLTIKPLNRIESGEHGNDRCRVRLQFAITSQNDKSSKEGAVTVTVAAPLMFSRVTEELFPSAHFRKGLGLKLKGYDEQPHAESMRNPWGSSMGVTIFPGEWYDFYGNPISFDVPTLALVPDPTYLFRTEMMTLDRPRRSALFALRQSGTDSNLELIRIDNTDDAAYYEFLEAFWDTYHRARRSQGEH